MDNDNHISSDMSAISENNLGAVLFPDYGSGNLILTSDIGSSLSSFEGALCFDETNELVYVNMPVQMISSSMSSSDSLPNANSNSVFPSLPPLSDLSLFNDGGQVMLFTHGSVVIPNDDDNPVSSNPDPFVLEYVLNSSQSEEKQNSSKVSSVPNSIRIEPLIQNQIQQNEINVSSLNVPLTSNSKEITAEKNNDPVDVKHICKLCSEKFHSLKDYRKHLSAHKDHKMHQCKFCGLSFNKINNLILHEVIHKNETRCPISNCQKKFNRKASLKSHVKLHEEDESLTCSECGEEFRNQLYLELHCQYQSQCRISNHELITTSNKTFSCKLCNRNFDDVESFNAHKKEHEKLKKALATKSHRRKTIPAVPSSRINRCKMCPKWFLKPSQLVRHMRIHTGERPFVCDICNKAFNQANSLKIHMLKHTGDRPFQCPFCLTSFSQRGNLRQHINRVHSIPKLEENVYKCSECPCIFKKMCSLNAHKNRAHQQRYYAAEDVTNEDEQSVNKGETAITIENGVDDVNDEDMSILLDKDSDINTISINFDSGNGTICHQKVFIKKKGNIRYYKCSHCPKQNVRLKEIIRHLKVSTLGKPFKCDYCSKMFSQQSTFLTHLTLHATAKTYQCSVCDKTSSNPIEMKIHSKTHVLDAFSNQELCLNCLKSFPIAELENHRCISLISKLDENVNLKSLEKKTNISETVKVRDKVSLILPPYDCNYCEITFDSYSKLKQHLHGIHDAVICEMCCLEFPDREKLREHAASHREEDVRNKTCSKCDKQFRTKYRRDMHFKTHFKYLKNGVECKLCCKLFKDQSSLGEHMKKFHKDDTIQETNDDDDLQIMMSESCDIDLANGLDDAIPFANGDVYVPCSTNDINSDKISVIDISTSASFPVSDVSVFSTSTAVASSNSGEFNVNESSVFSEAQIHVDTSIENAVDITNDPLKTSLLETTNANLPSQVLTLDSIDDNLFDFQSTVIPVEVNATDAIAVNEELNVAGAVIYKSTKFYQQNAVDLQKQFQGTDCDNVETNVDDYFYACNTCYLTFKNLLSLLRHLQIHDGTKSFECLYCGTENKTQAQLTHHIAQHSLQKEFPCIHCGELFDSLEMAKKHITDIHLMSSVDKKSEQKRKKNSSSELLLSEEDKLIIADQKPHKYSSISEKVLSALLKNSTKNSKDSASSEKEEKPMKKKKSEMRKIQKENICPYCSRGFKKMCDLVRHIRIHTGEKPYKCDYCSKCFTVKSILNCHLKTHFSVNNIFCHICNRFFATVGSLKTHMRLHTGERPYKCLYCKETFRTSGHRDSHQKRHLSDKDKAKSKSSCETSLIEIEDNALNMNFESGINIQECEYIIPEMNVQDGFKFQDIDLTDLSNLPSNKRTNSCTICRKVFKKKSDLDRHMHTHTDDKAFKCDICDSKFNQLSTFKMHLCKHTNDQLWTCDICDSNFASSKNLKIHKVRHHPETLNLPVRDANEKLKEVETNKDVNQWSIPSEIFADKAIKKYDNVSDFYIMDKNFDLNSMIQDLFPDDEKQ